MLSAFRVTGMKDNYYIVYDSHGRGILVALTYRVLKNGDVIGWFYGYAGNNEYAKAFFRIVLDTHLQPAHYYAGSSSREWDRDYLTKAIWFEESIFIDEDIQQIMSTMYQNFSEYWLLPDKKKGCVKMNNNCLKEMEMDEDDIFYCASKNTSQKILNLISSKCPLVTPMLLNDS